MQIELKRAIQAAVECAAPNARAERAESTVPNVAPGHTHIPWLQKPKLKIRRCKSCWIDLGGAILCAAFQLLIICCFDCSITIFREVNRFGNHLRDCKILKGSQCDFLLRLDKTAFSVQDGPRIKQDKSFQKTKVRKRRSQNESSRDSRGFRVSGFRLPLAWEFTGIASCAILLMILGNVCWKTKKIWLAHDSDMIQTWFRHDAHEKIWKAQNSNPSSFCKWITQCEMLCSNVALPTVTASASQLSRWPHEDNNLSTMGTLTPCHVSLHVTLLPFHYVPSCL